jgi:hypothetical protein
MTDHSLQKPRRASVSSELVPLKVSRAPSALRSTSSEYSGVGESSERWRASAESVLRNCPSHDDFAYIEQFLGRLKADKFEQSSDTILAIRAAQAARSAALAKRRLR